MIGILGTKKCEMYDRVFGLKLPRVFPYTWSPYYTGDDLCSAVIVPARRMPFVRSVGGVAIADMPEVYQSGFEVTLFPWRHEARKQVRQTLIDTLIDTQYGDGDGTCWGSRVTYTDDVQTHVHYLFSNQDDSPGSVSVWNKVNIDLQQNEAKWFRRRDMRATGYGQYSTPTLTFLGTAHGGDEQPAPNQWGVGLDYFVYSSYEGNPAIYGPWSVSRWKREEDEYIVRDNFEQFAGIDDLTKHTVVMPAPRTYRYTNIPGPQEPWVIAHAPNYNGGSLVCGIWLNTLGHTIEEDDFANPRAYLIGDEIKQVVKTGWNGDVICYNRVQQSNLIIIALDKTQLAGWEYFNGTSWFPTVDNEHPTWITKDWQGRLYYGNSEFVRQLPSNLGPGWRIDCSDEGNDFRHSSFRKMFQILPTRRGLDLRYWFGTPEDSTVQIEGVLDGVTYNFTSLNHSSRVQYGNIFNWTISFDSLVREPHVQYAPRYTFTTFPGYNTAGNLVYSDIVERLDARYVFGRSYTTEVVEIFGRIETQMYDNFGLIDPPLAAKVPWSKYPDFVYHANGYKPLRFVPHGDANTDDQFTVSSIVPQTASRVNYDPVDTFGDCDKKPLEEGY